MVAVAVRGNERTIVSDRKAAEINWSVGGCSVNRGVVVDDAVSAAVRGGRIVLEIVERVHRCRSSLSVATSAARPYITVIYFPRLFVLHK